MSDPGASHGAVVGAHLEWTLSWGWAPRVAVFALGLVVLWLAWSNLRQLDSLRQRAALFGLRAALVLGLLLAVLQPTWVTERSRPRDRVFAVLIDQSRSMDRGDRADVSRRVAARVPVQGSRRHFAFASGLVRANPGRGPTTPASASPGEGGPGLPPRARGDTDIGGALATLAGPARPDGLAGVVVISDGLDPRLARGVPEVAREAVAALAVPVHTVAIASPKPRPDLDVIAVRASPYAFVRNQLPLEIDLHVQGFAGASGSTRLTVLLDGEPLTTREIPLDGPTERTVQVAVQPKAIGAHVLSVDVAPLPEEVTRVNNRAHRPLHVVRDRTRVLLLAGHPSWDTRFLRAHLRADPAVDLVSFYIMVGRGGGVFVRGADTSLIPFPTEQLFGEALDDFDLVIFQDFDFAPFGITRHLPRLRRWVQEGGAYAVTGGVESMTSGGWDRSSLSAWFPLRMALPTQGDQGWTPGTFQPKRTDVGRAHAVTRLADDGAANDAIWQRLRLAGHNTLLTPRDHAAVLVHGPDASPLLTLAGLGRGRIAVLATDSLWTWAFPEGDVAQRDLVRSAYHRLLTRLRGWLLRDPAYASVRVRQLTAEVAPGDRVTLDVEVVGADQRPLAGAALTLAAWPLPRRGGRPKASALPQRTDAKGHARVSWTAAHGGPWRLRVGVVPPTQPSADSASAGASGRTPQFAELAVAVAEAPVEDLRVQPAPERLQRLAALAGGRHRTVSAADIGDDAAPLPGATDAAPELAERERRELWSTPPVALLLLGLLVTEWALRRRWGLA